MGDTFPEAALSLGVQSVAGMLGLAQTGQDAEPQAMPHSQGQLPACTWTGFVSYGLNMLILLYIFTTVYIFIDYFYQGFLDYVYLFYITSSL